MNTLAITSLLALLSAGSFVTPAPLRRVPVAVELVGDDGLTQRLSGFLQDGLRRHKNLRLAISSDNAALTIRSRSNVGWDKLGGQTVLIYTFYVGKAGERSEPITGVCYERAMSKCVNDILRVVSLAADPM